MTRPLVDLERLVAEATPEQLPALVGELARLAALAQLRLRAAPTPAPAARSAAPDRNVSVEEAASRLGVSKVYIFRHARELAFVRKIGRRVVCSSRGLEQWQQRPRTC